MPDLRRLRQLQADILANGKVEGHELETLRQEVYADGKVDRREAEFLADLHRRVERVTPAFEQFFFQALKDHLLEDGKVDPAEARWLRAAFPGDEPGERAKKFLRELRGEARQTCPEFESLCKEWLG